MSYWGRRASRLMAARVLPSAARVSTWRRAGLETSADVVHGLEGHLAGGEPLPQLSPLLAPVASLVQDRAQLDPQVRGRLLRHRGVVELEPPVGPQEQVVEMGLGVGAQRLHELLLGEEAVADQDLAQPTRVGLLLEERGEERLLGDVPLPDQRLPDRLARVVGARPLESAGAEGEPLLRGQAGHHEDARPLAAAHPGQEVEDVEGVEIASRSSFGQGSMIRGRGRLGGGSVAAARAPRRPARRVAVSRKARGPLVPRERWPTTARSRALQRGRRGPCRGAGGPCPGRRGPRRSLPAPGRAPAPGRRRWGARRAPRSSRVSTVLRSATTASSRSGSSRSWRRRIAGDPGESDEDQLELPLGELADVGAEPSAGRARGPRRDPPSSGRGRR